MALTDLELKIATFIEQSFWTHGGLPSEEVIVEKCGTTTGKVRSCWKNPSFRQALVARGVDLDPEKSDGLLTPTQVLLANMLLNTHDTRSVREKLEMINVSSQQYHAWLRQPAFSNYLRVRSEEMFKSTDFQAYNALSRTVESGDVQALKLFFEMRGIYNPRLQVDVNIEQIVVRIVEIVAKHVGDPEVLTLIANDIETLDLGIGRALPSGVEI